MPMPMVKINPILQIRGCDESGMKVGLYFENDSSIP
jgi:hypothetical protein